MGCNGILVQNIYERVEQGGRTFCMLSKPNSECHTLDLGSNSGKFQGQTWPKCNQICHNKISTLLGNACKTYKDKIISQVHYCYVIAGNKNPSSDDQILTGSHIDQLKHLLSGSPVISEHTIKYEILTYSLFYAKSVFFFTYFMNRCKKINLKYPLWTRENGINSPCPNQVAQNRTWNLGWFLADSPSLPPLYVFRGQGCSFTLIPDCHFKEINSMSRIRERLPQCAGRAMTSWFALRVLVKLLF